MGGEMKMKIAETIEQNINSPFWGFVIYLLICFALIKFILFGLK